MITSEKKERWDIQRTRQESLKNLKLDDREFVIFRTCLNIYKKDLDIVFITKKKFCKLKPGKQDYLRWKFEEDRNTMEFFKYLWCNLRKTRDYTCGECGERTKYLYIVCTNTKYIKEFRSPDWKLCCKKCWNL